MKININNCENLPFKQSRKQYLVEKYGNLYNIPKFDGYSSRAKREWAWNIAYEVAHNNIGKSFAMAFHYYCTKVSKREQYRFKELFFSSYTARYSIQEWFLDDNGNIVYNPWKKKPKKIVFYSIDYKSEKRNKYTNKKYPEYWFKKPKINEEDYYDFCIQGFSKEFETKNCKEFKRLRHEANKAIKKQERLDKKRKDAIAYNFLTKDEINDKKESLLKLERKGFDKIHSFRNH
jgi:hypothetical protein